MTNSRRIDLTASTTWTFDYEGEPVVLARPLWRQTAYTTFRVNKITEYVTLRSARWDGISAYTPDSEMGGWAYSVRLAGPVQTTRGADRRRDRDSRTFVGDALFDIDGHSGARVEFPDPVKVLLRGREAMVSDVVHALGIDLAAVGLRVVSDPEG